MSKAKGSKSLVPGMLHFATIPLGESFGGMCSPVGSSKSDKWYPGISIRDKADPIEVPDEGVATVKFKVTNRETNTRNGVTKHSASMDILSIDLPDAVKKKPAGAVARKVNLSSLRPGMIHLDARPRDNNGQYVANETGGADPNSMAAAYGGVAAEKQKRLGLIQRLRRTLRPGMVPPPAL